MGRLVASRWTGDNTAKQTEEVDDAKDRDHAEHEGMPGGTHDEAYDGYASETDNENERYDHDNDDVEDEIDDDFREDDHDDSSSSYISDSENELDLSGLQHFLHLNTLYLLFYLLDASRFDICLLLELTTF